MDDQQESFDWEKLGKSIQDTVDRAVSSQNYQKLNQDVRRAVENGTQTIRRTVESFQSSYQSSSGNTQVKQPPKEVIVEPAPAKNLPALYGSTTGKMLGGIFSTIGGGILTAFSGTSLLLTLIFSAVFDHALLTLSNLLLLVLTGGGIGLLRFGIGSICRANRFEKYVRAMGKKTTVKLTELAHATGKSVKFVKKEVRKFIETGMFPQGHLDAEETCLITSNETYAQFEKSRRELENRTRQEKLEKELEQTQRANTDPQLQEVLDRGNAYVRKIRACNDAIPGEEISRKISRMELIVEKIFERAREHPEIVPDLKKLMDYYLPMTVKLLDAYADMDAQPVQGQTIQTSKKEIEDTLDTLNAAFEKLLDSVFQDTAMDVSSDISVLHTLLAQEGLTEDEFSKMKQKNQDTLEE